MTRQPPEFIYFDMGNVLVTFDEQRAIRQMAEVAGIEPGRVRRIVLDGGLQQRFESGLVTPQEFHETFCRESGTQPEFESLQRAGSEMFELNLPMVPVVVQLFAAGYRLGILSNTCLSHWDYLRHRFLILRTYFETVVLSYEVGAMKPAEPMYRSAIARASVPAERIFYTDDRIENVEAARRGGLDAVLFTTAVELAEALRGRGVDFNY